MAESYYGVEPFENLGLLPSVLRAPWFGIEGLIEPPTKLLRLAPPADSLLLQQIGVLLSCDLYVNFEKFLKRNVLLLKPEENWESMD